MAALLLYIFSLLYPSLTPLRSRTLYSPCNYRARITNYTDCSVLFWRVFAKNTGLHRDRGAVGVFRLYSDRIYTVAL
jgi:hypothetical protein